MHATPPLRQIRRVPPGIWAAMIWCTATADDLRFYVGIPGLDKDPLSPWAWLLVGSATVTVLAGSAVLGRLPLPALGLLLVGSIAVELALNALWMCVPQFLAIDVALGFIVATRSRRTWIIAFVMALGVLPGYAITRLMLGLPLDFAYQSHNSWNFKQWSTLALTAVIAWLVGHSVRQAREYAQQLSAHTAAQAVAAERLRISRELHDMVAHSIGIIALQAGAAAQVIHTQPGRAHEAMIAVETTGRETLSGLRRMLGTLRQAEPGHRSEASPLHPLPGLADVDRLASATTAAGVRVDVQWQGQRRPLPPDIDLAAFRIIQESVTNVVRHGGTRSCQVSIDHREDDLAIEVIDSGSGSDTKTDTGYGLAGMRERVALLHGDFTARPRPEGGFRVTARLPVPARVQ